MPLAQDSALRVPSLRSTGNYPKKNRPGMLEFTSKNIPARLLNTRNRVPGCNEITALLPNHNFLREHAAIAAVQHQQDQSAGLIIFQTQGKECL